MSRERAAWRPGGPPLLSAPSPSHTLAAATSGSTGMLGRRPLVDDAPKRQGLLLRLLLVVLVLAGSSGRGVVQVHAKTWPFQVMVDLPEGRRTVLTATSFIAALSNNLVTSIHLAQDLVVPESAWPAAVVLLRRNLTITSLGASPRRLLNFTTPVRDKLSITPGLHLVFRNLFLTGMSMGASMSVVVNSTGAIVSMLDGAWLAPVCPTSHKLRTILSMHPRPAAYPGWQDMYAAWWPFCIRARCYINAVPLKDWACDKPLLSMPRHVVNAGCYTGLATNWAWVCSSVFSDACIARKGYDSCRDDAMRRHMAGLSDSYDARLTRAVQGILSLLGLVLGSAFAWWAYHHGRAAALAAPGLVSGALRKAGFLAQVHTPLGTTGSAGSSQLNQPYTTGQRGGRALNGHFVAEGSIDNVKLGSFLGSGSFSRVYQGSWQDKVVAVKVIPHGRQGADKIAQEAALSLSLKHPNLVRTYHHFTIIDGSISSLNSSQTQASSTPAGGTPGVAGDSPPNGGLARQNSLRRSTVPVAAEPRQTWIIQEMCDLGTLSEFLKEHRESSDTGCVQTELVLSCALGVARGMAFLHEHNVCHGDLKACNTLLMSDPLDQTPGGGIAKVADFGLSRVLAAHKTHLSTNTIGTLTHMPPELLLNGQLTRECDVYSYGIVMWEIATGEPLYGRMNPAQIMHKVLKEKSRPSFPDHVPAGYVALACECWAHEKAARPTFAAVVQRLEVLNKQWTQPTEGAAPRRLERNPSANGTNTARQRGSGRA